MCGRNRFLLAETQPRTHICCLSGISQQLVAMSCRMCSGYWQLEHAENVHGEEVTYLCAMRRLQLTVFLAVSMTSRPGSARDDCDWTQPRCKCCGWALSTNWSSSAFKMFQSCQHPSGLLTQHVTGQWQWLNDVWPLPSVVRPTTYGLFSYEWSCIRYWMTLRRHQFSRSCHLESTGLL